MFPPLLEKRSAQGALEIPAARPKKPSRKASSQQAEDLDGAKRQPAQRKRNPVVAQTRQLPLGRRSERVRANVTRLRGEAAARKEWPPEVKAVLREIRAIRIEHATRVNGPPADLRVPGFEPRTTLGGSSGMAYLTTDERHVVKMYSTPGIANYELWVTRFFEAHGIPVPKVVLHTEAEVEGKKRYLIVKEYAEGFLLNELKHPAVQKLKIMPYRDAGSSVERFARRIRALHGPAFGEFLAEHQVDPEIFGFALKAQFLEYPGDVEDGRIWDNVLLTAGGWVLFDP
ncbi:MAG: hypothetical protein IT384_09600 [Deltaproteobacteria bacterium]|nr:hypothetical protein [Deltaproteobacteria bacterium]